MSKSIKLKDNTYIDTNGIAHNKIILNTILDKLIPTILYSNDSGANVNITLTDNSSNYSYIEILYNDNDGFCGSCKIKNPNGKIAILLTSYINSALSSNFSYVKVCYIKISGNTISKIREQQAYIPDGSISTTTYFNINMVLGYK